MMPPSRFSLGETVMDRFLNPVYAGLTRTALTEAEDRYGPYVVGGIIGLFLYNIYLGITLHRQRVL